MPKRKRSSTSTRSGKRKTPNEMPVYVVDLHDGAMIPFVDAIKKKELPKQGCKMLHYDSHPDLGNIERKSRFISEAAQGKFSKKGVDSLTDIATWITPLVVAGYLDEVIWVAGHWCKQIKEGSYTLVCGIGKDGKLKTCDFDESRPSSALKDYWQGDGTDSKLSKVRYQKKWILHVVKYSKEGTLSTKQTDLIKSVCVGNPWVLDIDEDFFSCNNPYRDGFEACFGKSTFTLLKTLYDTEIALGDDYGEDLMKNIFKKKLFVRSASEYAKNTLVRQMIKILNKSGKNGKELMKKFYKIFNHHYQTTGHKVNIKPEDLYDFTELNDTGEMTGLPHHISELDEITAMGNTTERLLKSLDRPLYVTFATSRTDRYLPDCQAAIIHGMLDEMVERVYKRVNVIRRDCPKYSIPEDDDFEDESGSNSRESRSSSRESQSDSGDTEMESQSDSGDSEMESQSDSDDSEMESQSDSKKSNLDDDSEEESQSDSGESSTEEETESSTEEETSSSY